MHEAIDVGLIYCSLSVIFFFFNFYNEIYILVDAAPDQV